MSIIRPIAERATVTRTMTVDVVEEEERTYRAVIETPRNGPYNIFIWRERVKKDSGRHIVSAEEIPTPTHRLAQKIAGESVTLPNGTVVQAAVILEALPLFFDRWAQEDAV